jgi:dimethylaniline monooxygenase (N-oxide forming)
LAYGFEPVIFERLDQMGGLWRYKPKQFESDLASVMKFTVIDTSKEMNAYSDFPPPEHFANYMHNVIN